MRDEAGAYWRVTAGIFCATAGVELTGFLGFVGVLSLPVWLVGVFLLWSSRQMILWELLASAALPALAVLSLLSAHEETGSCSAEFDPTGMTRAQINAKFAQLDSQLGHACGVDLNSASSGLRMLAILALPALVGLIIWLRIRNRILRVQTF